MKTHRLHGYFKAGVLEDAKNGLPETLWAMSLLNHLPETMRSHLTPDRPTGIQRETPHLTVTWPDGVQGVSGWGHKLL